MVKWASYPKGKPDVFGSEVTLRSADAMRRGKINKLLKLLKDGPNKEDVRENLSGSH